MREPYAELKTSPAPDNSHRPRLRDLGLPVGQFPPGALNAVTDVAGVKAGHATLLHGEGPLKTGKGPVRTGVTAILPHAGNTLKEPVEAGCHVFNGAGTTAGLSLLEEYGQIETPVLLTSTLAVGTACEALVRYVVKEWRDTAKQAGWFNPLVGETDDSFLSDAHGLHLREKHVLEAIRSAHGGPVAEGVVGAGTGIRTCGFKAGIGTSSRLVRIGEQAFTVGVLVQSNFLGSLTVDGIPVGRELGVVSELGGGAKEGSLMAILATDLPLSARQLKRLAARGVLGMARTGAYGGHSSGDYFIAFSTTYRENQAASSGPFCRATLTDDKYLTPVFAAAVEAVEEAILNSIFKAVTVTGRDGNTAKAIDVDKAKEILRKYGRIS